MWRFFLDPSDRPDPRFSGKNTFGNDRAYRKKGNYFSGKKGAEAYGYLDPDPQKGEVMPSRILSGSGFQGDNYAIMRKIAEWPQAWVKQRAYNIDYTWKPQNSPWLDLQASLWATRTKSKTNSAGGVPGDVAWFDNNWDGDYIGWLYGGTGTRPRAQDGLPNTNGCASIPAKAKPYMPPTTATASSFPTK